MLSPPFVIQWYPVYVFFQFQLPFSGQANESCISYLLNEFKMNFNFFNLSFKICNGCNIRCFGEILKEYAMSNLARIIFNKFPVSKKRAEVEQIYFNIGKSCLAVSKASFKSFLPPQKMPSTCACGRRIGGKAAMCNSLVYFNTSSYFSPHHT